MSKFQAVCVGAMLDNGQRGNCCWNCVLRIGSKRDCELEATSHMKVTGHGVTILQVVR